MKIFCLFIFLIFFIPCVYAQVLEKGGWNDFTGRIGKKDCQLSLYLFDDGTIRGNYVFKHDSVKHYLSGHLKKNAFFLREDGHKKAVFKGNAISDPADEVQGTYTDSLTKQTLKFGFLSESTNIGRYGNRYADLGATEDEIEGFVKTAKRAILNGDKKWLAKHVQYPVRHVLGKGYPLIKNKQLFIKYFDQIFTQKFKDKVRQDYVTNLFTKYDSVMLGNGEIWVSGNSDSAGDKPGFIIIAINNK